MKLGYFSLYEDSRLTHAISMNCPIDILSTNYVHAHLIKLAQLDHK
jgi:hypothetical protein